MSLRNIPQIKSEIKIPKVMGKVLFNSDMSSVDAANALADSVLANM